MTTNTTEHIKSFAAKKILLNIEYEAEIVCTLKSNRGSKFQQTINNSGTNT